jgi:hypothetical protein
MPEISKGLLLAILAMDTYNRVGSGQVNVAGNQVGDAAVGQNSGLSSDGFFAQEYNWEGQTVISYSGSPAR